MSVRMATVADLPAMLEIYTPYVENTTVSFEYTPPTLQAFTDRFLAITARFPWLVWEEDGCVLGYAYGSAPFSRTAYQWSCEVSIYLAPKAHRRGIGRILYTALEYLMSRQGFRMCYALITSPNTASLSFHSAMGYKFLVEFHDVGFKMGQWLGVVWMEKELNYVEISSAPPIPFPELVKSNKSVLCFLDNLPLS